eukprot:2782298-Alexandrium_andersonii.AAC.1
MMRARQRTTTRFGHKHNLQRSTNNLEQTAFRQTALVSETKQHNEHQRNKTSTYSDEIWGRLPSSLGGVPPEG